MSLTNRILIAMVAGIVLGCLFNVALHSTALPESVRSALDTYIVSGLLDAVGRIFVASLKLLVLSPVKPSSFTC
jgi:Na+/H+-dicarboxylate symporter